METSRARFKLVPAGRRSGKTERAVRYAVRCALRPPVRDAHYILAAPTYNQAKSIFWDKLKAYTPAWARCAKPSESELLIRFLTGSDIRVLGMDKPERAEGKPIDGIVMDEYANMKASAWELNIRPALSTPGRPPGWARLIGVPEGRNHYYDLVTKHRNDPTGQWSVHHWVSADIMDPEEVAQARRDLDELSFRQEYEADFVTFHGQAYYAFDNLVHCDNLRAHYNPQAPLNFCFDFNVDPGVAVITQEIVFPKRIATAKGSVVVDGVPLFTKVQVPALKGTAVLGEVHIPRNSTTPKVCAKLIQDWGGHAGHIFLYGDASGIARGSAKTEGSDWDLIRRDLYAHFGRQRVHMKVPDANGTERARVNAMNCRLMAGDGTVRMLVDGHHCPKTIKDLEGVRLLEGGTGEIDKKIDRALTHLSDALGYYIVAEFPVHKRTLFSSQAGAL
jgi:hypothetical protein